MSECNLCTLNQIKKQAEAEGLQVTLKTDPVMGWGGGTTVFVHKKGEEIDRSKHFAAWLASVPDHCMCGES